MDNTFADFETTGLPSAAEFANNIILWIGGILIWIIWIGGSTAAVTYLAYNIGKRVHVECHFQPVTPRYGDPEIPYKDDFTTIPAVMLAVLYIPVTIGGGINAALSGGALALALTWLEIFLITLGLQGM